MKQSVSIYKHLPQFKFRKSGLFIAGAAQCEARGAATHDANFEYNN
ncbi:hypothetical protein CEV32_4244 [Brucella rhizosphaerae]|uniref:Uncharacterized protein n=1 Tax=Brucella rhizosphaerae TaxID=571254 RepID=A0A256FQA4_9HYPH|nr:hypothetical protein CEV32_4244 [Brucella rhizosphaerae]